MVYMTATASQQVSATTIPCANGEQIQIVELADCSASVTLAVRPLFNTTFTADRIPVDMTPAQAAAEYAQQLAGENGGRVMAEGEHIVCRVGAVEVVLLCVRPNAAYRVRVLNGGREVDELSRSYPTEAEARGVARSTVKLFNRGASVQLVLDSLDYAQTLLAQTTDPSTIAA